MNIKTLERIHKLLLADSAKAKADYQAVIASKHELEDAIDNCDCKETLDQLESSLRICRQKYEESRDVYFASARALDDFETHEW